MFTPSMLIDVWLPGVGFVGFALAALVRSLLLVKRNHWDDALTMFGLSFAFIIMWFTILTVRLSVEDNAQATHRHNCIMYEFALQRNADPDLPDVDINPAWHKLECYSDP